MKAIVYTKKGSPHKLVCEEIEKPVPGDKEVLVKIHTVSLNAADYRSMKLGIIPKSKIFGADVAGTIETVGSEIIRLKPGDEVMGDLASYGFGGLAEYVAVPEKALVKKPSKISFEEAATIPLAAVTALQALRDKGNIQKGQKVLIVGSAGGVGTFAVQLAKYYKTEVSGVCSTKNIHQTLFLGADYAIDYKKEDFTASHKRYDLILGINGSYPLLSYRKILRSGGIYVMIGGSLSQIFKSLIFGRLMSAGSKKMKSISAKANQKDLNFLASLMENGVIRAVIDRHYPLDQAADAMQYLSQGHSKGKVLVNI